MKIVFKLGALERCLILHGASVGKGTTAVAATVAMVAEATI